MRDKYILQEALKQQVFVLWLGCLEQQKQTAASNVGLLEPHWLACSKIVLGHNLLARTRQNNEVTTLKVTSQNYILG